MEFYRLKSISDAVVTGGAISGRSKIYRWCMISTVLLRDAMKYFLYLFLHPFIYLSRLPSSKRIWILDRVEDLAQEMSYILFEKANQGLLSSLRTINQKNYIDVSRIRARVVGVEGTHADHMTTTTYKRFHYLLNIIYWKTMKIALKATKIIFFNNDLLNITYWKTMKITLKWHYLMTSLLVDK